jgi:hypothetical protein
MLRCTPRALILSFCLLSLCAVAQENQVVKVGVAVMKNASGRSVPGTMERDRLVAALNQQKPDKKTHLKVQGIPLEGMTPDEVGDEAKRKNCDYVVYTTLVELQSSTDPNIPQRPGATPGATPGGIQTNPNGQWGVPPGGRNLNPEYRATVEYRLYRAGNPAAIASAPFSNQQPADEETVVSQVMNQIANKVWGEIKKAQQPMHE